MEKQEGKARVYFLANTPSVAMEMRVIIQEIQRGGYPLVPVLVDMHPDMMVGIPENGFDGVEIIPFAPNIVARPAVPATAAVAVSAAVAGTKPDRPAPRRSTWIPEEWRTFVSKLRRVWRTHRRYARSAEAFIDAEKPAAFVYLYAPPVTAALLSVARRKGIRSVCVQAAINTDTDLGPSRLGKPEYDLSAPPWLLVKKLIALFLPGQVVSVKGGRCLLVPIWSLLGGWLTGTLAPAPYRHDGGLCTYATVIDESERRRIVAQGGPKADLFVTGQPSTSHLYRSRMNAAAERARLIEKYRLSGRRPLICATVPAIKEKKVCPPDEITAELDWFFSQMAGLDADVLMSVHPRAERHYIDEIAARHGVAVATEGLSEILGVCDVYASVPSTTLRWGALLGLQVIVIDIYENMSRPTPEILAPPGIKSPETREGFMAAMVEAIEAVDDEPGTMEVPPPYSPDAEVLDGRSVERIIGLISEAAGFGKPEENE